MITQKLTRLTNLSGCPSSGSRLTPAAQPQPAPHHRPYLSGGTSGATHTWTTARSAQRRASPLFPVTNATAAVTLRGVPTSAISGVLLRAAAAPWVPTRHTVAWLGHDRFEPDRRCHHRQVSAATLKLTNGSALNVGRQHGPHRQERERVARQHPHVAGDRGCFERRLRRHVADWSEGDLGSR